MLPGVPAAPVRSGVPRPPQTARDQLATRPSPAQPRPSPARGGPLLAFIDEIVIPFLNALYGAVGYLGVMVAMAIESAMVPLPSELILPYAGFLVSDPGAVEPLTGSAWNFWIVVTVATIGNTLGSLVAY